MNKIHRMTVQLLDPRSLHAKADRPI